MVKNILSIIVFLIASLFLASAGNTANATVACCYSGGQCAEAITAQQCRNTGGSPASAETCDPNPCGSATAEEIAPAENVGILPTNPIYFIKEWGRGLRMFFTFNPISKTELELKIANEKAAEAKKVEELRPNDAKAVNQAIENYQESQGRLKARLEALKETSQNPNVERLLDQLADRTVKHEKVFDEIAKKFENQAEVQSAVKDTKEKIVEVAAAASKKDDPAKFASKLEKALTESQAGGLEHVRSVDLIDRIQSKVPKDYKKSLERLRQDFSLKLESDIKDVLEKENVAGVRQAVETLPGDANRQSVILEEIRLKSEKRVAEAIGQATEVLEKTLREEKNIAQKAEEQIKRAEEKVNELEKRYSTTASAPRLIKNLLVEAKENLDRARGAFQDGKYGEAFGQARSAEVLARNAFRLLDEEGEPVAEDLKEILEELAAKIDKYEQLLKERGYSPENNPKAYALLADAQKHLGFARDAFAKNDLEGTKSHASHVKGYLSDLSRLLESAKRAVAPVTAPAAVSPASLRSDSQSEKCEVIQRETRNLKSRLVSGELTEEQYKGKLDNLQKEYEKTCAQAVPQLAPATPPTTKPVSKPVSPTVKVEPATVEPAPVEPESAIVQPVEPAQPAFFEYKIEADDNGFYPSSVVGIPKGSKVKLHFIVRTTDVYYEGLRFTSSKFKTDSVKSGESAIVEFTADESFVFQSWWPLQDVLKATGKVNVQ